MKFPSITFALLVHLPMFPGAFAATVHGADVVIGGITTDQGHSPDSEIEGVKGKVKMLRFKTVDDSDGSKAFDLVKPEGKSTGPGRGQFTALLGGGRVASCHLELRGTPPANDYRSAKNFKFSVYTENYLRPCVIDDKDWVQLVCEAPPKCPRT